MKHATLKIAAAMPLAAAAFTLLTYSFIPADEIFAALVAPARQQGITIAGHGVRKSFPLGLQADSLTVARDAGTILQIKDARMGVELLPLLRATVRLAGEGSVGGGRCTATAVVTGRERTIGWHGDGVRLEEVPLIATASDRALKGVLAARGSLTITTAGLQGEFSFEVTQGEMTGLKVAGMALPDAKLTRVQGALTARNSQLEIKSCNFSGDDIYGRISGSAPPPAAPDGNLALTLELMPRPALLERQKLTFTLLSRYLKSPGAYAVPIGGTWNRPSLG